MPMLASNDNEPLDLIPISFLQSGSNLPITPNVSFKHPTIEEIFEIDNKHLGLYSEEIYYSMVNIFLTDPYVYMVYLDDKGIDYEQVKPFELFIMLYEDYIQKIKSMQDELDLETLNLVLDNNIYNQAFKFFFGIENFYITEYNSEKVVAYLDNEGKPTLLIDSNIYLYINEFIKKINGIGEPDKIYPEEDWAKRILIEDERERLAKEAKKKNKKPKNNRLGEMLSAITWASNGCVSPFNRNKLHVYDLIDGIHRTDKLYQFNNTMVGLYSGCVDKKKINFEELHWAN